MKVAIAPEPRCGLRQPQRESECNLPSSTPVSEENFLLGLGIIPGHRENRGSASGRSGNRELWQPAAWIDNARRSPTRSSCSPRANSRGQWRSSNNGTALPADLCDGRGACRSAPTGRCHRSVQARCPHQYASPCRRTDWPRGSPPAPQPGPPFRRSVVRRSPLRRSGFSLWHVSQTYVATSPDRALHSYA